ncbi:MAG: cytochrome c [Planctomycetota bacterium]|nr:cytochrome c [Planctomycetota bacterium]
MKLLSLLTIAAASLGLARQMGAAPRDTPPPAPRADLHPGLRALYETPLQDFGLDAALFDELWRVWTGPARRRAARASAAERRAMTLERYGLFTDPDRGSDVPVAFAERGDGRWALNCLGCHSGQLDGVLVHGLGGSTFDFQLLVRDLIALRARRGLPLSMQEQGMAIFPLGGASGVTNAQGFSVVLAAFRHGDLSFSEEPTPLGEELARAAVADLDAPPLWHLSTRSRLYLDGYVAKDPRVPMQFSLGLEMEPARVEALEPAYQDIWRWMESLEPPTWPHEVDMELAATGAAIFRRACARCHGTAGDYPERRVPLDVVGTDALRARSMPRAFREFMSQSWLTRFGEVDVELDPEGYVAPPLDGIWASAPYFHNGSVPTLWHVLHPDDRPEAWRRVGGGYDAERVGLAIEERDERPRGLDPAERRTWVDTAREGRSAGGHRFPGRLAEEERRALLEYLKTL